MIDYGFWFLSKKFKGILFLLAALAEYDLWDEELEIIKESLIGTNDELNKVAVHSMKGKSHTIDLRLAFDAEEGTEMIHIKISTSELLKEKLEALNLFQSMVKGIELE